MVLSYRFMQKINNHITVMIVIAFFLMSSIILTFGRSIDYYYGKEGNNHESIIIRNVYDLQNMSKELSTHYILDNDIDASVTVNWNGGSGFLPIGNNSQMFNGSLDGKGYKIKNLYINRSTMDHVGLIGYLGEGGLAGNITLQDVEIHGNDYVGGLVGCNMVGRIKSTSVTGKIYGNNYTGGIIGKNIYSDISNSFFYGYIKGYNNVGGLVGDHIGGEYFPYLDRRNIENSKVYGTLIGRGKIGGIAGEIMESSIINCHSYINITGYAVIGGLIGSAFSSTIISNSSSQCNIEGTEYIGGLIGLNSAMILRNSFATGNVVGIRFVGGLIGTGGWATITKSYSTGNVKGIECVGGLAGGYDAPISESYSLSNVESQRYGGGLVGYLGSVSLRNSYARGNVMGNVFVGGLVGYHDSANIAFSYSTGEVTGSSDFGGLIGKGSGTVSNCFWDLETSSQAVSVGGIGKTTEEMKKKSTFTDSNWDFENKWFIFENVTYPLLRWQEASPPVANAGPDQVVEEGTLVTFDGSASRDDVGISNYTWIMEDLTSWVRMYGVNPTHYFPIPGNYTVTLKVTDHFEKKDTDTMTVTVRDITRPVADAGPDRSIEEDALFVFDGRGSYDPYYPGREDHLHEGIANFTWTFPDGVDDITLYRPMPTYIFGSPGIYAATLNVTDGSGNWDTDVVNITVRDITPPFSDPGSNLTVDEGTLVVFDGSGSYDNVGIINWTWSFSYGNENIEIHGLSSSFTFFIPGYYIVKLTVSDASGNTNENEMYLTVRDITPPVAKAGGDMTVPVGVSVLLNGSLSTDNWSIKSFFWTLTYDDEEHMIEGEYGSFTFLKGGVYEVLLTVVDRFDNEDTDKITITVVDTGRVIGIVLDGDSVPVEGATVEITASNGLNYTTKAGSDGSFSMEIYQGAFDWNISKSGYRSIWGSSFVDAMGEVFLNLSDDPLIKEEIPVIEDNGNGFPILVLIIPLILLVIVIIGIAFILLRRKNKKMPEDDFTSNNGLEGVETQKEEITYQQLYGDLPVVEEERMMETVQGMEGPVPFENGPDIDNSSFDGTSQEPLLGEGSVDLDDILEDHSLKVIDPPTGSPPGDPSPDPEME